MGLGCVESVAVAAAQTPSGLPSITRFFFVFAGLGFSFFDFRHTGMNLNVTVALQDLLRRALFRFAFEFFRLLTIAFVHFKNLIFI